MEQMVVVDCKRYELRPDHKRSRALRVYRFGPMWLHEQSVGRDANIRPAEYPGLTTYKGECLPVDIRHHYRLLVTLERELSIDA